MTKDPPRLSETQDVPDLGRTLLRHGQQHAAATYDTAAGVERFRDALDPSGGDPAGGNLAPTGGASAAAGAGASVGVAKLASLLLAAAGLATAVSVAWPKAETASPNAHTAALAPGPDQGSKAAPPSGTAPSTSSEPPLAVPSTSDGKTAPQRPAAGAAAKPPRTSADGASATAPRQARRERTREVRLRVEPGRTAQATKPPSRLSNAEGQDRMTTKPASSSRGSSRPIGRPASPAPEPKPSLKRSHPSTHERAAATDDEPEARTPAAPAGASAQPTPRPPASQPETARATAHADPVLAEMRAVASARALVHSSPSRAHAILRELDRTLPDGHMLEERAALAVLALRGLGQLEDATRRAEAFLQRYPQSAYAGQVRAALDD